MTLFRLTSRSRYSTINLANVVVFKQLIAFTGSNRDELVKNRSDLEVTTGNFPKDKGVCKMAEMTSDFVQCIRVEDIPEGSVIAVNVEGHSVALTCSEGKIRRRQI